MVLIARIVSNCAEEGKSRQIVAIELQDVTCLSKKVRFIFLRGSSPSRAAVGQRLLDRMLNDVIVTMTWNGTACMP
jgi:hypothetical protein